jgi:hypothetical protein
MIMAEEFYPMPLFVKLFVADVSVSANWYRNALGFRSVYAAPGADGRQVINHLRLDPYQDLMLLGARMTGVPDVERGFVINLTYNHDMRALADRARAREPSRRAHGDTLEHSRGHCHRPGWLRPDVLAVIGRAP